jgi:hypothetical protein
MPTDRLEDYNNEERQEDFAPYWVNDRLEDFAPWVDERNEDRAPGNPPELRLAPAQRT